MFSIVRYCITEDNDRYLGSETILETFNLQECMDRLSNTRNIYHNMIINGYRPYDIEEEESFTLIYKIKLIIGEDNIFDIYEISDNY